MLLSGLLAQAENRAGEVHRGTFWFPERASTFAYDVDWLFYLILIISTFFFVVIMAAMIYFCIRYRRRPGHEVPLKSPSHHMRLELAWTILPSLLLVWIFVAGAQGFFKQRIPTGDAYEILVHARQFSWQFTYPNGSITQELHLALDVPVQFRMQSDDVLHSFFVPAFRQKFDIVPGRYTTAWVNPIRPGDYRLYCAEYCGEGHSLMTTDVYVHPEPWSQVMQRIEWRWGDMAETLMGRIENGQRLYNIYCAGCHSLDGSRMTGPSFLNLWGTERPFSRPAGSSRIADADYIRESLLDPNAQVVAGYIPQMPTFQGRLTEDEIGWLIDFIRSLGDPAYLQMAEEGANGVDPEPPGDLPESPN